jgi:hypothetical protein
VIEAAPKQDEAAEPRVVGLVADSAQAYAERRGALAIAFDATRDGATRVRDWLETACAIEGCSAKEARSLTDTLLRQLGFPVASTPSIGSLPPVPRVALALAEAAIATWARRSSLVVVPAPPLPWPARNDARRLALDLFAGVEVVLHAREAWELAHLVPADALIDERDRPLVRADARAIVARVYGSGKPYATWLAALEALGVAVEGGPIAHVLRAPEGVGVREILGAAYDAGLDLLEIRELLDRP